MRKDFEIDGLERAKIIERLIDERGYVCERCKCELSSKQDNPRQRQLHHKKPLSEGGDYSDDNLELLCLLCHRAEHGNVKKSRGEIFDKIKNSVINKIDKRLERLKNKRLSELHDLPGDYSMREFRIRENEIKAFCQRIKYDVLDSK